MADRLKDRVALVIGAGASGPGWGNGKATAVLFAREGATVVAVDVNDAAAQDTVAIIQGEGGNAHVCTADVTSSAEVKALVEDCTHRFGRIDILHHNVGIVRIGGPVDLSEEDWQLSLQTNLTSCFLTCRFVIPIMETQGKGVITTIGSIAGIRWSGVPYIAYSATKAAIMQLTRCVALQYAGKGIRANCILPGLMDTPMIYPVLPDPMAGGDVEKMVRMRAAQCPMGHMGDAWDVAHAALFLASDEAKYITGTNLVVDGGLVAKFT
jgi:NAD(P)-dependent dehydrogenase (short-subunit alcohol dehydrogenase family)